MTPQDEALHAGMTRKPITIEGSYEENLLKPRKTAWTFGELADEVVKLAEKKRSFKLGAMEALQAEDRERITALERRVDVLVAQLRRDRQGGE